MRGRNACLQRALRHQVLDHCGRGCVSLQGDEGRVGTQGRMHVACRKAGRTCHMRRASLLTKKSRPALWWKQSSMPRSSSSVRVHSSEPPAASARGELGCRVECRRAMVYGVQQGKELRMATCDVGVVPHSPSRTARAPMEPALEPDTTRGRRLASNSARTTPKCQNPKEPPPLSTSPVRP